MGVALRGGAVRVCPLTSKKLIDRDSGLFQNGSESALRHVVFSNDLSISETGQPAHQVPTIRG